jgi:pimeloyl-ACP methyl ester carboxylesterase
MIHAAASHCLFRHAFLLNQTRRRHGKNHWQASKSKWGSVALHYDWKGCGAHSPWNAWLAAKPPQFLPVIEKLAGQYRFIVPDLRGYADSDKPFSGYEPKTIAQDMLELLEVYGVDKFHILSHDLGGPPSVALAYMANDRALSLCPRSRHLSSGLIFRAMLTRGCPTGIWACT